MDKINLKAVLLQNMGEDSADFLPIMGDEKELLNDNMQDVYKRQVLFMVLSPEYVIFFFISES